MILIDLTQTFNVNMPVYPGDPKPVLVEAAPVRVIARIN